MNGDRGRAARQPPLLILRNWTAWTRQWERNKSKNRSGAIPWRLDVAGAKFAKNITNEQDRAARSLNLVILGIPEHPREDASNAVFEHVLNRMQVVPKAKFHAFRLRRRSYHDKGNVPAPMMVQFRDVSRKIALESRILVMKNKSKLKGTQIRILTDLSAEHRHEQRVQFFEKNLMKEARRAIERGIEYELRLLLALIPKQQAQPSMDTGKQEMEPFQEDTPAEFSAAGNSGHTEGAAKKTKSTKGSSNVACGRLEMESRVEARRVFSQDLLDKVVARMPFPSIFKARGLSKTWLMRLSGCLSSQANDKTKQGVAAFQKLVSESSNGWKTLCPVWIPLNVHKCSSFGYDCEMQKWQRLPPLSFLPETLDISKFSIEMEGALMHGLYQDASEIGSQLVVANMLTRNWTALPPRPAGSGIVWKKLVSHDPFSSESYKMIMLCVHSPSYDSDRYFSSTPCMVCAHDPTYDGHGREFSTPPCDFSHRCYCLRDYALQVYDSNSNAWTSKKVILAEYKPFDRTQGRNRQLEFSSCAYLDGVLYMFPKYSRSARPSFRTDLPLLALNTEDGVLTDLWIPLPHSVEIISTGALHLQALGSGFLLVIWGQNGRLQVFTMDVETLLLTPLTQSPPVLGESWIVFHRGLSGGNSILLRPACSSPRDLQTGCSTILRYALDRKEWSCHSVPRITGSGLGDDWSSSSFQHGLNTFMVPT